MSGEFETIKDAVTNNTTVVGSAVTLINGFKDRLDAAVAAALAAGATPEHLQELTDLSAELGTQDTALAAAVAANTPVVTSPPSTGGDASGGDTGAAGGGSGTPSGT